MDSRRMSTLVFVDLESSTQADGAQSSRVPPFEDLIDTETPESPLAISPPIPLSESTPPVLVPILRRTARMAERIPHAMSTSLSAGMAEVAAMSESLEEDSEEDDDEVDEEIEESMDSDSDAGLTAGVEGPGIDDKGYGLDDESRGINDEGHSVESDGFGLKEEKAVPRGQQQAAPVVGMTGSGSAPESKRHERVSAFRQPTLTTWTDPKDGMIYIDIPDYPPSAPPVQTPPSLDWTSGSLLISSSPSDNPSPISSPMIPLTIPSPVATPAAVETEGFLTELGAQESYSLGRWRLGRRFSPRGQTDAQRAALWHAISDVQGKNRDLRLQHVEERRARLELAEVVDGIRRGQEPRGAQFCPCVSALRLVARGRADTHTFIRWWRAMYLVYSNGLPRMGRAEMVDQARFAWGFLSVFGNANSDRVAIMSRTGSYPDTQLRQ
ncbi:hypothetical protein Tco_0242219 [Tanacetum coccineum]